MTAIWQNLSIHTRRLMIAISTLMVIILIGMQFHVSSQGDMSETYPKGFRGGTCTIESDTLLIGYSAYFIPKDYEIPQDALSAVSYTHLDVYKRQFPIRFAGINVHFAAKR